MPQQPGTAALLGSNSSSTTATNQRSTCHMAQQRRRQQQRTRGVEVVGNHLPHSLHLLGVAAAGSSRVAQHVSSKTGSASSKVQAARGASRASPGCRSAQARRQQGQGRGPRPAAACLAGLPAPCGPCILSQRPRRPHRMARRPEAARPSSTRTPSPATGAFLAAATPWLAALWNAFLAAPLSISFSRCAMKYLSTAPAAAAEGTAGVRARGGSAWQASGGARGSW